MNIIIITGASSGIGMEFARQIDRYFKKTDEIWLVARRREKMESLALEMKHVTRIFTMDLTNDAQLERLEDSLREHKAVVRMLVNAAGYGLLGAFASQDLAGSLGMIRLNCEALTSLTHRVLPFMKRGSRIIQMASAAAFLPQVHFAVYAATKAYVLSFSRALGAELKDRGIYVTAVCPGPVDTPFFEIAERFGKSLSLKKHFMVKPEQVVDKALRDSYHKRSLSVCSIAMNAFYGITKMIPHRICLKVMKYFK